MGISLSSAGFAFAIYEALVQRDTIRWSLKSHKTPATIIASNLSLRRFGALLLASVFGPITLAVGYALVKPLVIHALLALPVIGGTVRPFIAPLLRARAVSALDGGLYRLASAVAFRALVTWEISGAVRAGYQAFVRTDTSKANHKTHSCTARPNRPAYQRPGPCARPGRAESHSLLRGLPHHLLAFASH